MSKLQEFDKNEWRDVVRRVRHDWTDEQFETAWSAFITFKSKKALH